MINNTSNTSVLTSLGFLITALAVSLFAGPPEPVVNQYGEFRWLRSDTPLVLGRVAAVQQSAKPGDGIPITAMRYTVTVISDFRGRIHDGTEIVVSGERGLFGSMTANIPLMERGTTFIFVLTPTERPGAFAYDLVAPQPLPIGISCPSIIPETNVVDVLDAFVRLSSVVREHGGILSHKDALALLEEKNHYLWALGVSATVIEKTPESEQFIEQLYREPKLTARQALWLDDTLDRFPEDLRPSYQSRRDLLREFTKRSAGGPIIPR